MSEWPVPTYFDCTERKGKINQLSLSNYTSYKTSFRVLDLKIPTLDFYVLSFQEHGLREMAVIEVKEDRKRSPYSGP